MPLPWLLLATLLAQDSAPAPLASGLVRSLEIESPSGTFVQHFRLDREGSDRPLALLRYVAGPDPAGGVHADLEILYTGDDLRIFHSEQAAPAHRRLVFREVRERAGRTLFLEATPGGGCSGYELGGRAVVDRELQQSGEFPLLLVEAVRAGLPVPPACAVIDPLAGTSEPLHLETREEEGERVFEARRADGSLRWRVRMRGEELVEWRFQERGPAARAIDAEEYERLRAADAERPVASEAAAATPAGRPRSFQTGYR